MRVKLQKCDLAAVAPGLGLMPPESGSLRFDFLGRRCRVDDTGVYVERGDEMSVNGKTVIVYYLTYGGSGFPRYDFRFLKAFASGLFDGSSGLAHVSGQSVTTYARFADAATRIGAQIMRESGDGSHTWLLSALPKVPALLTFLDGDDEFSPQLQVKFDVTATDFLPFETLAVLGGLIEGELLR
jgi:hypothetical protein